MPDDVFISVTEAMATAGETLEAGATNSLLVTTLAEDENMAVLGGDTSPAALNQLRNLLNAICERSVESPSKVTNCKAAATASSFGALFGNRKANPRSM